MLRSIIRQVNRRGNHFQGLLTALRKMKYLAHAIVIQNNSTLFSIVSHSFPTHFSAFLTSSWAFTYLSSSKLGVCTPCHFCWSALCPENLSLWLIFSFLFLFAPVFFWGRSWQEKGWDRRMVCSSFCWLW